MVHVVSWRGKSAIRARLTTSIHRGSDAMMHLLKIVQCPEHFQYAEYYGPRSLTLCLNRSGLRSVNVAAVQGWTIGGAVLYLGVYTLQTNSHRLCSSHPRPWNQYICRWPRERDQSSTILLVKGL